MANSTKLCSVCKKPKPTEYEWNSPYCQDCHDRSWGYETELHMRTMYPTQPIIKKTHYDMCYICLGIFEFANRPESPILRTKLCVNCYEMKMAHNVKGKKK